MQKEEERRKSRVGEKGYALSLMQILELVGTKRDCD